MTTEVYPIKALKDIGKLSDDGIMVFDVAADRMLYCNEATGEILEKSIEDLLEGGVSAIVSSLRDEKRFLSRLFDQLMEESRVSNVELRVVSEGDKYVTVDAYWIAKRQVVIAIIRDITKSRKHVDYIVEFGARKNTLLDSIAHDLSGPLNLINSLLDALDRVSMAQNYKRIEQPARLIRENAQQCIDIINSFLREEHIASTDVPVGSIRFDVLGKIKTVVDRYAQYNPSKQFKIVSSHKELFATGDDVKFFQVVNNLVSNSVKFTDEKGKITVDADLRGSTIVVTVKDNGIGIPEYLHRYIFDKNTRAARNGLRGEKSTGLGLYIIKKLVELMGGTISFESEEGKGSAFSVTIPAEINPGK